VRFSKKICLYFYVVSDAISPPPLFRTRNNSSLNGSNLGTFEIAIMSVSMRMAIYDFISR